LRVPGIRRCASPAVRSGRPPCRLVRHGRGGHRTPIYWHPTTTTTVRYSLGSRTWVCHGRGRHTPIPRSRSTTRPCVRCVLMLCDSIRRPHRSHPRGSRSRRPRLRGGGRGRRHTSPRVCRSGRCVVVVANSLRAPAVDGGGTIRLHLRANTCRCCCCCRLCRFRRRLPTEALLESLHRVFPALLTSSSELTPLGGNKISKALLVELWIAVSTSDNLDWLMSGCVGGLVSGLV